jgi:hypothetical protein
MQHQAYFDPAAPSDSHNIERWPHLGAHYCIALIFVLKSGRMEPYGNSTTATAKSSLAREGSPII